jgi:glycosyltransferase involved in cell wall biosynthesis
MRVLHLNTDDVKGGAARAAHRLHVGLRRAGVDSSMFVLRRSSDDLHVRAAAPPANPLAWLRRTLRRRTIEREFARYAAKRPDGLEPFSDDRTEFGALAEQMPACDVLNLHWLRKFLDLGAFFATTQRPVVWTLHDMNAFTGGCHYDAGCGRFTDRCGRCPQLGSADEHDLSRAVWERKKAMFDALPAGRLHIVALCEWMAREVRRSPLLGRFPVSVIPNGLDTEVFAPRDRRAAREQLGLPVDGRLALFVAESVKNRRKGFQLLLDALRGLNLEDGITLLSIGRSPPELSLGCGHKHLGEIHDDATLAAAYSAADVFVLPSLQDNLPNTALESLACGTPVVAFDTGGIPDIVRPGLTGALAPVGDPAALRKAITSLLGDSDALARMSAHCREVAVKEYALEVQTKRYAALYEKLLGQGG